MTEPTDLPELLGLADIALVLDLSAASVRTYHTDANRRRRDGESLAQDMPAPDMVIGRTPVWKAETVAAWVIAREDAGARNMERLRQPRGPRTPVVES